MPTSYEPTKAAGIARLVLCGDHLRGNAATQGPQLPPIRHGAARTAY